MNLVKVYYKCHLACCIRCNGNTLQVNYLQKMFNSTLKYGVMSLRSAIAFEILQYHCNSNPKFFIIYSHIIRKYIRCTTLNACIIMWKNSFNSIILSNIHFDSVHRVNSLQLYICSRIFETYEGHK